MNNTFGLDPSTLPPELLAQLQGVNQQQMIAQALMQQSQTPLVAPESKGRFQGRISPLEGISKLVQAYMARQGMDAATKGYTDIANKGLQGRADANQQYENLRSGSPAAPANDSGIPMNDALGDGSVGGNITTPAKAGTPGDPRAAIAFALQNQFLKGDPRIAQDLKQTEPKWAVHEQFDAATGGKKQVLVNLNNPAQVVPFGGIEAPKKVAVETVNEQKQPVTKFIDPQTFTGTLPKPIKFESINVGNANIPFNPYNPEPLARTITPSDAYHRETQYAVAGLGPDGLPTGDISEVAKAIASGAIAPLSSFAMAKPRGQAIMAEVMKINPAYDVKQFKAAGATETAFAKGKQGDTVRSFNVALNHLDTLDTLAGALGNGDVQLFNKVSNAAQAQFGSAPPMQFDAVKKIVGDEIVKAIVGSGGGVADREKAAETISRANSPQQLKGVITSYKELMKGQLQGLHQQYKAGGGTKDFNSFLTENSQNLVNGTPPSTTGIPDAAAIDAEIARRKLNGN